MEMQKMALLAQQRLNERYTNKPYQDTVAAKAEKTDAAVKAIDEAVVALAGNNGS